jgi:hypothetical protein
MLIYVTEFSARPDEEKPFSAAWRAYRQALLDAPGVYLGGEPLQPPSTATTVWLERGRRLVHDGPFAETKEQLGGYILLEVPSREEAIQWAVRCPAASYGRIEIRPILTGKESEMLGNANVQTMLPVKDLKTAEKFYGGTLGLPKLDEEPGGAVTYRSGSGTLTVYVSKFAGTNKGTAASWQVKDVEKAVQELKEKGVAFEHYDDLPEVTRKGDTHFAGPMKLAWFKDPAGNILGLESRA